MLNIQIKEESYIDKDGKKGIVNYAVVNDIADKQAHCYGTHLPHVSFEKEEVIEILLNHSFADVGVYFTEFSFFREVAEWENWLEIEVYCNEYLDEKIPKIKIQIILQDWENWAKPWSMSALAKEFELSIKELGNKKLKYWQEDEESMLNGFGIQYFPENLNNDIKSEVDNILSLLQTSLETTNKRLLASIDGDTVLTYFHFPEEIKTACKQYLVYFAQFMTDIGISVNTELKEEINHTLFKIIPKNENESLEKIREALDLYLNAPNDKAFQDEIAIQTDIAAKQWEANIYHLKSQLSLANSVLQANQATIEMLQLSNYQYKQLLESHKQKKESEKEDIIKDIVAVKKYDGKAFSVDFAEILRRLKRKFSK